MLAHFRAPGLGWQSRINAALRDSLSHRAAPRQYADLSLKSGAGEGIRTLDPNLGKVVLYP